MSDESLIEPFAVQEVFVDGWGERVLHDGIYSSAGYRIIRGEKVIVVRVAQRESCVRRSVRDTDSALNSPTFGVAIADQRKRLS